MPTEYNKKTGTMADGTPIYSSGVGTAPISSASLTPQAPIQLPPAPDNSIKYTGTLAGTQATIDGINKNLETLRAEKTAADTAKTEAPSDLTAMLQQFLGREAPPSQEAMYNSMYAASPIAANQTTANADAATALAEQDKANVLNAQLQGLNYQYQTTIPNQMQQDATGRGITAAGLAPITAAAQRTKMLEIAPVQFQALIQQAAVANANGKAALSESIRQQAQNHLDRIFEIHSKDALAQYEFKNKQIEAVYNFASKKEQARLEELKTKNQNDFTLKQDAIKNANAFAKTASENGQGNIAAKLMALDSNSPTYAQDVAKYAGQITQDPLDVALKKAQIASANRANQPSGTSKAPEVKSINGVDMQWNGTKWEPISSAGGGNLQQLATSKANVDLISGLTSNKAISSTVGTSFLSRAPKGFFGKVGAALSVVGLPSTLIGAKQSLTGERQNFIASVQQISDQLKLDKLIQSKAQGATFGALSDNELRVLASSATKIGTWASKDKDGNVTSYNTDEKSFKQELDKINNFAKLDYIVKGGDPADVNAKIMPDGTVWTTNSDGTYTQIK